MIYVTQGHEKGIGLEIFLKSFLMLPAHQRSQIALVAIKSDLDQNLSLLRLSPGLYKDLRVIEPQGDGAPASTSTLLKALSLMGPGDILATLPTSKDQLFYGGRALAGYTEFFREFYGNSAISMTFKGLDHDVLLITDHVALKEVAKKVSRELIIDKVETTLAFFKKYFYSFDEVIFSGLNPHVGENGILGTEDRCIGEAIAELQSSHTEIFRGPFSGDTLHTHRNFLRRQLLVYMFHDQGLAPFKSRFGHIGLNMSMGLPFLRLSVDHGTAFDLHGKNRGDISGMLYLFKIAFEVQYNVNQRN